MKKEVAERWVKALRSGKYKQAQKVLRRGDGYCCLGVLCDVTKTGKWEPTDDGLFYFRSRAGTSHLGYPPNSVMQEAEINDASVIIERCGVRERVHLTHLNDRCGYTFDQIADLIEAQWATM